MQLSLALDSNPALLIVRAGLLPLYGRQRDAQRHDPTTQFVRAMISGCTWDAVSDRAFLRLRNRVPSWDMLPDMEPASLAEIVWDVTRAARAALFLVVAARIVRARRGRFDLGFLAGQPADAAFSWLNRLPGVGAKIAAVTLNFSTLRKPVLVVDRHLLRVSWRYGLVSSGTDFARGFRTLMRLVPAGWDADDLYELHWLMKYHSQNVCTLQRPACAKCPLSRSCATYSGHRRITPVVARSGALRSHPSPGKATPRLI